MSRRSYIRVGIIILHRTHRKCCDDVILYRPGGRSTKTLRWPRSWLPWYQASCFTTTTISITITLTSFTISLFDTAASAVDCKRLLHRGRLKTKSCVSQIDPWPTTDHDGVDHVQWSSSISWCLFYYYYLLFRIPLATLRRRRVRANRVYADRHLCAPSSYLVPPPRNTVPPHAVITHTHTKTQLRIIDDERPCWRRGGWLMRRVVIDGVYCGGGFP